MCTDIRPYDNSFSELKKLWTVDAASCPLALSDEKLWGVQSCANKW